MTGVNSEILSKSTATVLETLELSQKKMEAAIEGFKDMQISMDGLVNAYNNQLTILGYVIETVGCSARTQDKILDTVENISEKLDNNAIGTLRS